jgi:hypothetical protein
MPSLRNSLIELDPKRYERLDPRGPVAPRAPIAEPVRHVPAPEPPIAIRRSPVMISSLPPISASVDSVLRQFYGGGNFPTRRISSF